MCVYIYVIPKGHADARALLLLLLHINRHFAQLYCQVIDMDGCPSREINNNGNGGGGGGGGGGSRHSRARAIFNLIPFDLPCDGKPSLCPSRSPSLRINPPPLSSVTSLRRPYLPSTIFALRATLDRLTDIYIPLLIYAPYNEIT